MSPKFIYFPSQAGGFRAQYQAVLDEGTSQGDTLPSGGQQILQNTFIGTDIDNGIFAKRDTQYVTATDGDSDFACLNWITPGTNDLIKVNSPTHTPNQGFSSDGISSYLTLGVAATTLPNFDTVNDSAHMAVYVNSAGINNASYFASATNRFNIQKSGSNFYARFFASAATTFAATSGLVLSSQDSISNHLVWLNGTEVVNQTRSGTISGDDWFLLTDKNISNFSDGEISFAATGGEVNAEEQDYYDSLNTYLSAI